MEDKTKEQLIEEIKFLQERIAEFEILNSKQQQDIRRYATVVRDSNDAIIIQDIDGFITTWNRGAELMYGYNEKEALGMNIERLTAPDKIAEQKEFTRRLIAGEAISSFETRRIAKDGSIFDVWLTVTKLVEHPGDSVISTGHRIVKPIGLAFIERNISLRKKTEENVQQILRDLKFERNKFKAILDAYPEGVYIVNKQYEIEYLNVSLEKEFGPTQDRKCFKYFHNREEPCSWCQNDKVFSGKTVKWEWTSVKNNKTYDLVDIPLFKEDGSVSKLEIFHDITERKKTEKELKESQDRMKDIVSSVGDWVWEVDEKGVYSHSSHSSLDILGRSSEEIIGKTPFDFMPQDEAKRIAAIFYEISANKKPIKDLENWNIKKNGERICLLTNAVPLLDEKGNLKGYRGVDKDITKRKYVEQVLEE